MTIEIMSPKTRARKTRRLLHTFRFNTYSKDATKLSTYPKIVGSSLAVYTNKSTSSIEKYYNQN